MSLEVKACAALTEPERAEILALQNEVYSGENLKNTVWLQTESHFDRTVPCFYLGRENDALTAFLSLFLPTQEEAEVTAFTKQSARNCGQFTALLHAAAKEMQVHGVPDFLFDLEPQSETGKAYLKQHFPNAVHSHTEYRMTREPAVFPLPGIQFPHLLCQKRAQDVGGPAQAVQPPGRFPLPHGSCWFLLSARRLRAMATAYHASCCRNSVCFFRAISYF